MKKPICADCAKPIESWVWFSSVFDGKTRCQDCGLSFHYRRESLSEKVYPEKKPEALAPSPAASGKWSDFISGRSTYLGEALKLSYGNPAPPAVDLDRCFECGHLYVDDEDELELDDGAGI